MKVRFFMSNGQIIEIEPPEQFDFNLMCMSTRAAGYFLAGGLYIDHLKINAMAYGDQQLDIKVPDGARLN